MQTAGVRILHETLYVLYDAMQPINIRYACQGTRMRQHAARAREHKDAVVRPRCVWHAEHQDAYGTPNIKMHPKHTYRYSIGGSNFKVLQL